MKYLLILILCFGLVGCKKEIDYEYIPFYITKPTIARAYIYYYESYRGFYKKWYWLDLVESCQRGGDRHGAILEKGDKYTTITTYLTPEPGGRDVEIKVPNELIYYIKDLKRERIIERKSKLFKKEFNNLPIGKPDIRKVEQYGTEVDMRFGTIWED